MTQPIPENVTSNFNIETDIPDAEELRVYFEQHRTQHPALLGIEEAYASGTVPDVSGERIPIVQGAVALPQGHLLFYLVRKTLPRITIETGFGYGMSASFILAAHKINCVKGVHVSVDPYFRRWTKGVGLHTLERLGLVDSFKLIERESSYALPRIEMPSKASKLHLSFIDGGHLFDVALIDFFYLDRMTGRQGIIVIGDVWAPALTALVNFIQENRKDYRLFKPHPRTVLFQKVGEDDRPWDHYRAFNAQTGTNWGDLAAFVSSATLEEKVLRPSISVGVGLRQISGPDAKPFVFPDEQGLQPYVETALFGSEYPQPFRGEFLAETIVDVGAHVGSATRLFHLVYPNARILAFEPNPASFALLQQNLSDCPGVELVRAGLAAKTGKALLFSGRYSSMQASFLPNEENSGDHLEVACLDAADAIASRNIRQISILKLDTEGNELPILTALRDYLPCTEVIYLEYHSEADRHSLDAMLRDEFALFHAKATEPDRGTLGYIAKKTLARLQKTSKLPRYAYPKRK